MPSPHAASAALLRTTGRKPHRSSEQLERELATVLRQIAASTRAGHSLEHAFSHAAARTRSSVAQAAQRAASQLAIGVAVERTLQEFADEVGGTSAALFAHVVRLQHRRGGDLGRICHRLARLLHERGRLRAEARSETAQARFTARAVLALPILLAVGMSMIAPSFVRQFASPGMLLLASPAVVLLAAGMLVVRRCALAALVLDDTARTSEREERRGLIARVAGAGSPRQQTTRTVGATACLTAPMLATSQTPLVVLGAVFAIGGAGSLPWLMRREARQALAATVDFGLPALLETSVALLAAGATPAEVVVDAIDTCPAPLGPLLQPAAAQIRIGRTPLSAVLALAVTASSPELEAWVFALMDGARYGVPATDTLESLLRDARSAQRERFRQRAATAGPRIQLAVVLLVVPGILWIMLLAAAGGLAGQLHEAGIFV